jgi:hypothetical protein
MMLAAGAAAAAATGGPRVNSDFAASFDVQYSSNNAWKVVNVTSGGARYYYVLVNKGTAAPTVNQLVSQKKLPAGVQPTFFTTPVSKAALLSTTQIQWAEVRVQSGSVAGYVVCVLADAPAARGGKWAAGFGGGSWPRARADCGSGGGASARLRPHRRPARAGAALYCRSAVRWRHGGAGLCPTHCPVARPPPAGKFGCPHAHALTPLSHATAPTPAPADAGQAHLHRRRPRRVVRQLCVRQEDDEERRHARRAGGGRLLHQHGRPAGLGRRE